MSNRFFQIGPVCILTGVIFFFVEQTEELDLKLHTVEAAETETQQETGDGEFSLSVFPSAGLVVAALMQLCLQLLGLGVAASETPDETFSREPETCTGEGRV